MGVSEKGEKHFEIDRLFGAFIPNCSFVYRYVFRLDFQKPLQVSN